LERRLEAFSTEAATKAEPKKVFKPYLPTVYTKSVHLSSG
jgi:hypothetical protein